MKGVVCVFLVLALCCGARAKASEAAEAKGAAAVLRCRVTYTILNGFVVRQDVRISLPVRKRDLAVWLVERKKGAFKKLAYPIGGEGALRITRPFNREKSVTYPFVLTWRPFGRLRLTGFFLSGRHAHAVVVREANGKRVIEIFPAFPGHIATKLARGECEE